MPASGDWIGLYPADRSDDTAYRVTWNYTGAASSGTLTLSVVPSVAPGTYQTRMFYDNGLTRLGASAPFTISAPSVAVSVSPTTFHPGDTVNVTWSSHTFTDSGDWLGLYPASAPDDTAYRINWRYTDGAPSGTLPFSVPTGAPQPPYEMRMFWANGLVRLGGTGPVGSSTNNPPVVTLPPTLRVLKKDGLRTDGTFIDPDAAESFVVTADYGDGTGPQPLTTDTTGKFSIVHQYARLGNFVLSVSVTDSGGATGTATSQVNVQPKRLVFYVHGTTGRQTGNDFGSALFNKLSLSYDVQRFRFYEDRSQVPDSTVDFRCPASGQRPLPTIDDSRFTFPRDRPEPAPGICDSNDDIELNGVLLDSDVAARSSSYDAITLVSNSGGGAIVRAYLAYAAAGSAAPGMHSLDVVDAVVFLEGVQSGTWLAAAWNGAGLPTSTQPGVSSALDALMDKAKIVLLHDPRRPVFQDVLPQSDFQRWVARPEALPDVNYVNVVGDIQVNLYWDYIFFKIPAGGPMSVGDLVMLPGSDDPRALPAGGGARLLPASLNRGSSSSQVILRTQIPVRIDGFDTTTGSNAYGSALAAGTLLAAQDPAAHTGLRLEQMCAVIPTNTGLATKRVNQIVLDAIAALDRGRSADGIVLGFGNAYRVACP